MSNSIVTTKVSVPQTVGGAVAQPGEAAPKKAPASLFGHSSFKQVAGAALPSGVSLPSLSQDQQQQVASLFGGLSDDDKQQIQAVSSQLAASIWQAIGITNNPSGTADGSQAGGVGAVGAAAGASSAAGATSAASSLAAASAGPEAGKSFAASGVSLQAVGGVSRQAASVQVPAVYTTNGNTLSQSVSQAASTYADTSHSNDPDKNVAAVTYMGLIGLQNDLGSYASTVNAQNNTLQTARTQYANLSDTVSNWPAGQSTVQFTWTDLDAKGDAVQTTGALTKDQAQAKANDLMNNTIPQLSGTNQISQLQLQNLTQNYQQGVNTLSNVLKFEFDTVKSIIGNIRVS